MKTNNNNLLKKLRTLQKSRKELLTEKKQIAQDYGLNVTESDIKKAEELARETEVPFTTALIHYSKQKNHLGDEGIKELLESLPIHSKFVNPEPEELFYDNSFQVIRVTDHLRTVFSFLTYRDTGEILVYENGVYKENGDTYIKEATNRLLDYAYQPTYVNKVLRQIEERTYVQRKDVNSEKNIVNVKNCLVDLSDREKLEHDPEYKTTIQLPVFYDENADCPKFKAFLDDILDTNTKKKKVQEMFGYCLLKDQRHQKAFLLHGDGSNGKSALLKILEKLLGETNTSAIDLQELQQNRFAVGRVYGKLANIGGDIPSSSLHQTNRFKKLVGGDRIKGEHKNQDLFEFRNSATLIFSANTIPKVENKENAFYRRWIIVEFPYKFTEDPQDQNKNKDPEVVDRIVKDSEEMSGILNWALDGLERLRKQDQFTGQRSSDEVRGIYERHSDPVRYFLMAETEDVGRIKKQKLFDEFSKFCKKHNLEEIGYDSFCKQVVSKDGIKSSRPRIDGARVPCFIGISLS